MTLKLLSIIYCIVKQKNNKKTINNIIVRTKKLPAKEEKIKTKKNKKSNLRNHIFYLQNSNFEINLV